MPALVLPAFLILKTHSFFGGCRRFTCVLFNRVLLIPGKRGGQSARIRLQVQKCLCWPGHHSLLVIVLRAEFPNGLLHKLGVALPEGVICIVVTVISIALPDEHLRLYPFFSFLFLSPGAGDIQLHTFLVCCQAENCELCCRIRFR